MRKRTRRKPQGKRKPEICCRSGRSSAPPDHPARDQRPLDPSSWLGERCAFAKRPSRFAGFSFPYRRMDDRRMDEGLSIDRAR